MTIEEIIDMLTIGKKMVGRAWVFGHMKMERWVDIRKAINEAIILLRTHPDAQPNEPLTLEELKGMYCQAVWVQYEDGIHGSWGLVELDQITLPAGAYCIIREDSFGTGWKAYRRPPKEG